LDLIKRLIKDEKLGEFNLVGGTSLSLQIGHRKSLDIDLFSSKSFDASALRKYLEEKYSATFRWQMKGGMGGEINQIKLDLMAHQYPLLKPVQEFDGIRLVSLEDIGAMKLNAITRSGDRPKDFIDMHILLEYKSLKTWTDAYQKKYPDVTEQMALQSLNYFNDIDLIQLGKDLTLKDFDWKKVTQRLKQAVKEPNKIFASVSKELKQSLEQKLKQERKLSYDLKKKESQKKSQRQSRGTRHRPT
jgi:hypothetical protein